MDGARSLQIIVSAVDVGPMDARFALFDAPDDDDSGWIRDFKWRGERINLGRLDKM